MIPISRLVAIHSIVGNAPYIISVEATAAPNPPRTFSGTGAPSATTLTTGNNMYNAVTSGFVLNASLVDGGSDYTVGEVLTIEDSCTREMEIVVDMVDASGAIIDFHLNGIGNCGSYPALPVNASGSSGTGAEFNLNFPAPDYYIDITTPTTPVLYVCTTSGSKSTSVWAKISGGGGLIAMYDTTGATAYSGGAIVFVASQFVLSGITVLPGTYGLLSTQSTPASPTGNQIPQIPVPSGTVYWIPIAAGLTQFSTCASGITTTGFGNFTTPP